MSPDAAEFFATDSQGRVSFQAANFLTECCTVVDEQNAADWLTACESQMPVAAQKVPFAPVWWRGVEAATAAVARDQPSLFAQLSDAAVADAKLDLLLRLAPVTAPTLLAQFHQSMTVGQRFLLKTGHIPEHPARRQFAQFGQKMVGGGLLELLRTYPLLAEHIETCVRQWQQNLLELLTRLQRHRAELEAVGVPDASQVTRLHLSGGDQHNDGRCVAVIRFGNARVVYKPRDVRLEQLWAEAVGILNRTAAQLSPDQVIPPGLAFALDQCPPLQPDQVPLEAEQPQQPRTKEPHHEHSLKQPPVLDLDQDQGLDMHPDRPLLPGRNWSPHPDQETGQRRNSQFSSDKGASPDQPQNEHMRTSPQHHAITPLRAASVLSANDGQNYGFTEFISYQPSRSEADLARFYFNAGQTLALLYALAGVDCHHDNLIAAGDQLVLIDAEALFETGAARSVLDAGGGQSELATVMDVGMLPNWLWLDGPGQALDISALGITADSMSVSSSKGWRAINSDAMSRGTVTANPAHPTSLPTANHEPTILTRHSAELVAGFELGYRKIQAAQPALVRLLASATDVHRRLILRPTYVYAKLLQHSWEPEALRSAERQAAVWEKLARAYQNNEPAQMTLLAAEQQALAQLDVPYFETDLTGRSTYWDGSSLSGFPGRDALADVQQRLAQFKGSDMAWQSRIVSSAVMARSHSFGHTDTAVAAMSPTEPPTTPGEVASVSKLAKRCLHHLVSDAQPLADSASWMTLGFLPDGEHINVQPMGAGLYDGVVGVASVLFATGETSLARAAVDPVFAKLGSGNARQVSAMVAATGVGWSGAGGMLRTLLWCDQQGYLAPNEVDDISLGLFTALTPELLAADTRLDVISGVAGLLRPLARLSTGVHGQRAQALLQLVANKLVAQQHRDGGWITLTNSPALTGLAHGASGIAAGLVQAFGVLGEERYLDAAMRGLDFEQRCFNPQVGNWPDLRSNSRSGFMLGWCAGAPGISLVRHQLLQLLADHPQAEQWQEQLEVGMHATASAALLERDHLCCGNLGRAAILIALGHQHNRWQWVNQGEDLMAQVVARTGSSLPRTILGEVPASLLPVTGLMTGLAGFAMVLASTSPRVAATQSEFTSRAQPGSAAGSPAQYQKLSTWVNSLLI